MDRTPVSSSLPGLLIIPLFLAIYLLSFTGSFRVDDEHILAARAQSLALWGELEAPQVHGNARVRLLELWGEPASQVEPGMSVLGAGFYKVGTLFGWGGRQTMFLVGGYATALTALLVFLTARTLGQSPGFALAGALVFSLATLALPYSLTFYRDSLAMLMAALVMMGLAQMVGDRRRAAPIAFGLLGVGVLVGALVKNSVLATLPSLGLGALVGYRRKWHSFSSRVPLVLLIALLTVAALIWSLPLEGPLARFSGEYYSSLAVHFTEQLGIHTLGALLGPWLSPAKSLFLFAPPLLFLLWPRWWDDYSPAFVVPTVALAFFLSLAQGLFYGERWWGDFGWGLRFMLPALPGLVVLSLGGLRRAWTRSGVTRIAIVVGLGAAILTQLAGSWVPWTEVYSHWEASGADPYRAGAVWDARLLAIPAQLSLFMSPSSWDVAWLRQLRAGSTTAMLIPGCAMILLVLSYWALLRWRRGRPIQTLSRVLLVLSLSAPLFPLIALLGGDPAVADDREHFHEAEAWLRSTVTAEDAVVLDSYGTPLWDFMMNRWRMSVPWHSLPFEVPSPGSVDGSVGEPSAASTNLFVGLLAEQRRLFYLTTPDAPDFSLGREIRWLEAHAPPLGSMSFDGDPPVLILVYGSEVEQR